MQSLLDGTPWKKNVNIDESNIVVGGGKQKPVLNQVQ